MQETVAGRGSIGFAPTHDKVEGNSEMPPLDRPATSGSTYVADTTVNCDDSNPCTRDYWEGNNCLHEAVSCDDGDSSTIDVCGPSGCIHTPVPAPVENKNAASLDLSSPLQTEIQNKTDGADGANIAGCSNVNCDDKDACTEDSCDNGNCLHTPKSCDDGNACTTDSCDPATGCTAEPVVCDDGNESTEDSRREGECNY